MTNLSVFLALYFILSITYWFSYIILRPHVTKKKKHWILFVCHMLLGMSLIMFLPLYLYKSGDIDNKLVLVLALCMGLSSLLHHGSILIDAQPWRGIITPKGIKIPAIHGAVSHLLFSISYMIYGVVFLAAYINKISTTNEILLLLGFIAFNELAGIIVFFDGVRMWSSRWK